MDDGFQNPTLYKDLNIIVIDAGYAFGNGALFPAGPLRAPLDFQHKKADVIILVHQNVPYEFRFKTNKTIFDALLKPNDELDLKNKRVIAYCGIARPEKFYTTLTQLGADIISKHAFADHHNFGTEDAENLLREAQLKGAQLITTEKDFIRLIGHETSIINLKEKSSVVKVGLYFSEDDEKNTWEAFTP